jgi:signal transduction histidine kinase
MNEPHNPHQILRLLILYRWLSLLPALIIGCFFSVADNQSSFILAFLIAVALNAVISLFPRQLNGALQATPCLLAIDLTLIAALIALTNGWRTPYYLYALSPLIAAAFFFQLRGALLATTFFVPMYALAVTACPLGMGGIRLNGEEPDWLVIVSAIVSFYLISTTFGYASMLFTALGAARDSVVKAHHELEVLHDLTVALQRAADIEEVQERVLEAITSHLGFKRAVMGIVEPEKNVLTSWLGCAHDGLLGVRHLTRLPLSKEGGLVAEALLEQRICRATTEPCTPNAWLNEQFNMKGCLILPMLWGIQPIGVLLVDVSGNAEPHLPSLKAIAQQTAIALGMMTTRLRRATVQAAQEERARIAQDMHDTVAQSLFGIVFTLDGCLKLLPTKPDEIKAELEWALQVAEEVRQDIRHSIHDMWPEAISSEKFEHDLRRYAADVLQATNLLIDFDVRGDFSALSSRARRSMYRICQEALTNTVHHAAANEARICVDVVDGRARLVIRDNGRGFEPAIAMTQEYEQEHFGLRGMQERARMLNGTCDIFSQPSAGTSIVIDIPANE